MLYLKIIASMVIIGTAGVAGLQGANYYSLRPRQLQALQGALQLLDTEISYGATPLPRALQKIGSATERETGQIFLTASKLLSQQQGITGAEAWDLALQQVVRHTSLGQEELAVLQDFGAGLGLSDRSEQHKRIALTLEQLRQAEGRAQQEREKNVRLWQYGGFMVGVSLVLLLL